MRGHLNPENPTPEAVEVWEVTEQILLAGLREHELADQLRFQLAFANAITQSMDEGVYALDGAGRITFVNPAAEQMLGWQSAELLGQAAEIVGPVQEAAGSQALVVDSPVRGVLPSGVTYRTEYAVFHRRDLSSFPVAYSAAPIITDGAVMGAVVAFRDLSELERLQQAQEEYLTLVSHDLRTPLTVILAHAQWLQQLGQQRPTEREAKSVEAILESGGHMTRMIQDLLDRSRLEAGRTVAHGVPVDLVEVFTRSVAQNITPVERARLQVDAVGQLPLVADSSQIERVIVNLLSNALKYSPPECAVRIRLFRSAQDAVLSVADQGVGIDAEDLMRLFEKHYRARTAGATVGSGLGLYGSRLIVEANGGQIWAESAVGVGSTFWVSLPLSDA